MSLDSILFTFFISGILTWLVAWIMGLRRAGKEGWFFAMFVLGVVALPAFALNHWSRARAPFYLFLAGVLLLGGALTTVLLGDRIKAYRMERSLPEEKDQADAHRLLASNLLMDGRAEAALPFAEKAVRLAPEDPHCRLVLGEAYLKLGRYPEAVENLELGRDSFAWGSYRDDMVDAYFGLRDYEKGWREIEDVCAGGGRGSCPRFYLGDWRRDRSGDF